MLGGGGLHHRCTGVRLGLPAQEWEQVVQANGIEDKDEYLQRCPRTGRGKTLSRPQRARIWKLFEHYRQALKRRHQQDGWR